VRAIPAGNGCPRPRLYSRFWQASLSGAGGANYGGSSTTAGGDHPGAGGLAAAQGGGSDGGGKGGGSGGGGGAASPSMPACDAASLAAAVPKLIPYRVGNLAGFIDAAGRVVVPAAYDETAACMDGLCYAKKGSTVTFLNEDGEPQFQTDKAVARFSFDGRIRSRQRTAPVLAS